MVLSAVEPLREFQFDGRALTGRDFELVMSRSLGAGLLGVEPMALRFEDEVVDTIFLIKAVIGHAKEAAQVALIVGK